MSSKFTEVITPSQYTKSNRAHFIINTRAVNDFRQVYPGLVDQDRVLDFGCGTGETTLALAQGQLGLLGNPREVSIFKLINKDYKEITLKSKLKTIL